MDMYLVYALQDTAKIALIKIWDNMKPPVPGTTDAWAVEQQRLDGKWVFPKPPEAFLAGVTVEAEEEFEPSWFE